MNYKDYLNLPKTKFPMKANLPQMEVEMIKFWDNMKFNEKLMEYRKDSPVFILHDGPPYANGHIHIGTTFNKILKDFIVKYKNIRNFNTPYVPGWDCHGMPIEHNVTKQLGEKAKDIPKIILRKKCRTYADKFVNIQKKEFHRLGVHGFWDKPYITMSNHYEATIIDSFGKLVDKGYIYRGLRPIHWCSKCQTALAGNEIEYENRESPSIFVKLKLESQDKYILIWTTTPWTLPANVATAFHPDEIYVEADTDKGILIFAEKLLDSIVEKTNIKINKIIDKNKSIKYKDLKYIHPIFNDKKGKIILADYVTMETGSGIVHIAPGHGYEDYQEGLKNNLDIISPVNERGQFTEYVKKYENMHVFDANEKIIEDLKKENKLLYNESIEHSYPVCWRCKSELIFRATEQWFLNVEHNNLREKLLKAIDTIRWVPTWSKDRIYNMVKERPDWCLSRQRSWGVPIPVFYCEKCREPLLDYNFIKKIKSMVLENGSDIWFEKSTEELSNGIVCKKCGHNKFIKEENIFDVWFDSALSHEAVLKYREELKHPSNLYLEAVDQHRGWFQVSLITAMALDNIAPYKEVLTHGLILDQNMKKMSKSLGNVVSPEQIWKKYGAEILRIWASSVDYTADAAFSEDMKSSMDIYRRIRNTFKFILGNLYDFDEQKDTVNINDMLEIDKYILSRLAVLNKKIVKHYDDYKFHKVLKTFHTFCSNELSSFYFDVLKDRLYTYKKDSLQRRSGQTAIFIIMNNILKMIAPIMPFTTEQAYTYFNKSHKKESLHFEVWDDHIENYYNEKLEEEWNYLKTIREYVNIALEHLRSNKIIGKSLEADIIINVKGDKKDILEKYMNYLPELFIVSNVQFSDKPIEADYIYNEGDMIIYAIKARGEKCERCWIYSDTVGESKEYPELCKKCADIVNSEVSNE